MGKRLGHMIREFREKQGRTIEEAARGLLSAAELSRVENGTKEIEYLIMEALFETYGKSLDKLIREQSASGQRKKQLTIY